MDSFGGVLEGGVGGGPPAASRLLLNLSSPDGLGGLGGGAQIPSGLGTQSGGTSGGLAGGGGGVGGGVGVGPA